MSGPVWRKTLDEDMTCDKCLRPVDAAHTEGTVVDGCFVPWRRLCAPCYEANIHLIGKMPINEMQAKP